MRAHKAIYGIYIFLTFAGVMSIALLAFQKNSYAECSASDPYNAACAPPAMICRNCIRNAEDRVLPRQWDRTPPLIEQFSEREFDLHQTWMRAVFWEDFVQPAMQVMADHLTAVAMQQTLMIGTLFDAKHQMESQRIIQTISARAHKDYHTSAGMCQFGTSVRSLASSERKGELNAHIMSQRSIDRQLGNANTSAAFGRDADFENRYNQFARTFCDPSDNNSALRALCEYDGGVGAQDNERKNKDIDFSRTVDFPWTLDVDFSDEEITDDEEEVLALGNNLYSEIVFKRITDARRFNSEYEATAGTSDFFGLRASYLDARALVAKRSVAENSYNSITAMKSAGTAGSREFLENILLELGVSDGTDGGQNELLQLLGMDDDDQEIGPSYHAQMEVLTKKIYQNPDFYTNLYDKPVNIDRKKVAMQAIGLMQKFDLFKSHLRHEANISVLLELAINDLQDKTEEELQNQ